MGAGASSPMGPLESLAKTEAPVSIQDAEFWENILPQAPVPAEKIFSPQTQAGIRAIKSKCPKNLATLVRRAVLKLQAATRSKLQYKPAQEQVLNTVRLLTKVIPNMFEDPAWDGFWWTPTPLGVITTMPGEKVMLPMAPTDKQPPLAHTLLDAIIHLLFVPNFTAESSTLAAISAFNCVADMPGEPFVWSAGLGEETRQGPPTAVVATVRNDLLRLLLVCSSHVMYEPAVSARPGDNGWLEYITSGAHPKSMALYRTLVNTMLMYDSVGWGLPFGSWFPDVEHQATVEACGDLIAILIDFEASPDLEEASASSSSVPATRVVAAAGTTAETVMGAGEASSGGDDAPPGQGSGEEGAKAMAAAAAQKKSPKPKANVPVRCSNAFLLWLTSTNDEKEFAIIVKGLTKLITDPLTTTTKLPAVEHAVLIILWRMIDRNERFLSHVLKGGEVLALVVPVMYYMHKYRDDNGQIGLVHICVYILLILSGKRNFAVRLNKEYEPEFRIPVTTFEGTHGDLLILVIHALLITRNPLLAPLYECLHTIIVNVSPYLKSVSLVGANKLVHLFETFSSPRYLFAAENNHRLIFFLIETFNNLIQYQFEGNQHLAYVIIRRRKIFTRLMGIASAPFAELGDTASAAPPQVVFAPESAVPKKQHVFKDTSSIVRSSLTTNESAEHFSVTPAKESESKSKVKVSPDDLATQSAPLGSSGASGAADKFVPSREWLESWRSKLDLEPIQRLLHVLVPQVEKLCADKGVTDEADILEFLQHGTMVGLLPVPHRILIRKHQSVPLSTVWYSSFVMGVLYLRYMDPPIWHGTAVRLFRVKSLNQA
eukprot:m.20216 g.20216  ORF g.20216 m.20216 type:complete len:828 (+) comp3767_c0_seq1:52-2535(+)